MLILRRSRALARLCVGWLLIGSAAIAPATTAAAEGLRIGVTLHPYYSWVRNLATDQTQVIPILATGNDPHVYQPLPEDIRKLATLDALVVNGLGHDDFVTPMLEAVGKPAPAFIKLNEGLPLVPAMSTESTSAPVNSHTFLSITGAIHQTSNLASTLQRIDPAGAAHYRHSAREYNRRLRKLQIAALAELKSMRVDQVGIGTVHDGYTYLLEDLEPDSPCRGSAPPRRTPIASSAGGLDPTHQGREDQPALHRDGV